MKIKKAIVDNIKNIAGWHTRKKLLAFAVDDYGNIRNDSQKARERMTSAGLKIFSRFDAYDSMETADDLNMLYDTLTSVKDINGRSAVFTPFALSANINFEGLKKNGFSKYIYESLKDSLIKLESMQPASYNGVMELILEGISNNIFLPEFHGREHLNIKMFNNKLEKKDKELLTALNNRSFTSISESGFLGIEVTSAFSFNDPIEVEDHKAIISEGIELFKKVFGYAPCVFTPSAQQYSPMLDDTLYKLGVFAIDRPLHIMRHTGFGKYRREFNFISYSRYSKSVKIVRNCVFEPTYNQSIDWVNQTLKQIETAFRWNKPAIISSHRVNYCGHIDPRNREKGINSLRKLLRKIVEKWPDVEFVSIRQIAEMIKNEQAV